MLGHWRCGLVCLVVLLNVAASDESSAMDIDVEGAGSKSKIPHRQIRDPDIVQRQVQIGPHGSLLASVAGSSRHNATAAVEGNAARSRIHGFFAAAQHEDAAALVQGDPSMTAFTDSECSGKQEGTYQFPAGADLKDPLGFNNCVLVKRAGKPKAHVRLSCESATGDAQISIFHDATDDTCTLNEPFVVVIAAADTGVVGMGHCIKATEHPVPNTFYEHPLYIRFTDFPEFTKWPDCLKPPMSPTTMGIIIMAGMIVAVFPLCCVWQCFFKLQAKQAPDPFGKGSGKGEDMPEGMGDPMMEGFDPMMGKGDPNMMGKGKPGFGK